MQVQVDIEFDQLVKIAKKLPAKQWTKLKAEVESKVITTDKKSLDHSLKMALSGSDFISSDPLEIMREQTIYILSTKFKNRGKNIHI